MFSSSSSSRSSSSKSSTNSCKSLSNSKNSDGHTKEFKLEDIDEKWETEITPITHIELLTRGLGGIALGAVHTALLFETNNEFVVVEYGDTGLEARYYPKNKAQQIEAYNFIMGESNEVYVFDITNTFEDSNGKLSLKLIDIYIQIDQCKHEYRINKYSFLNHNCRHFVLNICKKINCDTEGLTFLSSFLLNMPIAVKVLIPFNNYFRRIKA